MLTVAYLLKPELFKVERLYVTVDCGNDVARGQTVADYRPDSTLEPQMDVLMGADAGGVFNLYLDRVAA